MTTSFRKCFEVTAGTEGRVVAPSDGFGAITAQVPSRADERRHALEGVRICHCSSVGQTLDYRSFYLQTVSLAERGLLPTLIAPHGYNSLEKGVHLASIYKSRNRVIRILSASSILFRLLCTHADIYHLHDPELLPVGLVLKVVLRKKVVYDIREDYPLMMLTKPWIPSAFRPMAAKAVTCFERIAARFLNGIVTADSATLRGLAKIGKSKKRVFYNFPRLKLFPKPKNALKKYDLVYRGGISERAGTFVLLDAMSKLAEQNKLVRLLVIGYFDDQRTERLVRERIRAIGLQDAIEIRGRVEHHEMADALSEARVGICPLRPIPKFLHNIPVKVWEYWACGLAVIASDLPPIRPFFRNGECGILFKPDDPNELASAIRRLLEDPLEAGRMGNRGRQAVVNRLNNSFEVTKLVRFYESILS